MIKFVTVLTCLILLAGCSSFEVVGYDKPTNIVTIKGGKWSSASGASDEAHKYCASHVTQTNPNDKSTDDGSKVYKFTCDR